MKIDNKTAREYYECQTADREPYLKRARDVSRLTIPTLIPPDGYANGSTLPTPYQGMGSRGTQSLASKLLLALFPPNQSFHRFQIPAEVDGQLQGTARSEVEAGLAQTEKQINAEIESLALRPHLHEVKKHLLVAGNVCLKVPTDSKKVKVHHLPSYVVRRDPSGVVLGAVIKEEIALELLPDEIKSKVLSAEPGSTHQSTTPIYTAIVLKDDKYHVFQEVEGEVVPDSMGTYKVDELPWLFLRMEPIAGRNYGYGYIALLLGDLSSLEGLWTALIQSSAVSAKTIFLVNPTSSTRPAELANTPNGGFVAGMPDDIVPLRTDKGADMAVAFNAIERLERSLGFAFLLNQSVQRQGERVTAEEVKILAQELEDVLAGTYSLLSQELQLPLVRLIARRLEARKAIPSLKGVAEPTVVTGLEALGRGHDLLKLDTFVQGAATVLGPEGVNTWINAGDYLRRRATAVGLASEGLVRTEQEVQQREQQAMQAQTFQGVAPELVRQGGAALQAQGKQ